MSCKDKLKYFLNQPLKKLGRFLSQPLKKLGRFLVQPFPKRLLLLPYSA